MLQTLVPKEITDLISEMESVLNNKHDQDDWCYILKKFGQYKSELTETLCSVDSSDVIVSDNSNGLWILVANGKGWEAEDIGSKAEYRWNTEMIGNYTTDIDIEEFEKELKHNLSGINVVRLTDQGSWTKTRFEEYFGDKLSEIFSVSLENTLS